MKSLKLLFTWFFKSMAWFVWNPAGVGAGCAMGSNNSSNLLTIGVLNEQRGKNEQKVAIVSKTDKAEKMQEPRKLA